MSLSGGALTSQVLGERQKDLWVRITIHLYRLDPDTDPPGRQDVGISPIKLPVVDLDQAREFAQTAISSRLGHGSRSPTAGHVEDENGREVLSLLLDEQRKIRVERKEA